MNTESDSDTKKDLKRLKEIMLTDDEWNLMQQLTKLLKPFHDATELLGGEKYATASFMYHVLATLKLKVSSSNTRDNNIADLITKDDVFDDIEFKDNDDNDHNDPNIKIKIL